jgi:hypothetical protein
MCLLFQIFLFLTISKFGALNCALLGLLRKMLSLILSFVLYGHELNVFQGVGLALAIASMVANFYERVIFLAADACQLLTDSLNCREVRRVAMGMGMELIRLSSLTGKRQSTTKKWRCSWRKEKPTRKFTTAARAPTNRE